MPVGAARAVVRAGRAHGADALVSDDHVGAGLLVYDHISPGNTALAKYIEWSRRVIGEDAAEAIRRVPSLERSEEHTSELQSRRDLHSFPTRRSSDLASGPRAPSGARAERTARTRSSATTTSARACSSTTT